MKLNRSQKASLLKEIGNLISYFQTFEHMDVDKLINIMKEKYSSWKDANSTELYDDVNHVVTTLQNLIEEKVVETTTSNVTNSKVEVEVTGSQVSELTNKIKEELENVSPSHIVRAYEATKEPVNYLSSDVATFEDENYYDEMNVIDEDARYAYDKYLSFTGSFNDKKLYDVDSFSVSFKEFWSDDEEDISVE